MKTRLTPHLIELTYEAALRSFWRKQKLATFLRHSKIMGLPEWLPDESKRDYLNRVFELLQENDQGRGKILQLAQFLSEQKSFPDLEGWEDSLEKQDAAKRAIKALRSYLEEQEAQLQSEKEKEKARKKFREYQELTRASQLTLQKLSDRLGDLATEMGSAEIGKEFEKWFYDLMDFSEIIAKRPYKTAGREIDGSITIGDTTYLIECKFTSGQSGAPDVDIFRCKVESKADNTMGIFISMSGFSSVAIEGGSGKRTPLLLLDHSHLYRVLGGVSSFKDVVERVRRHCSQTGEAYLSVSKF